MIYSGLKNFDESINSLNKSVQLKPDYAEAFNNMRNIFKEIGDLDQSIQNYEETDSNKT